MFKYRLLITNTIISGTLFGAADIFIQCISSYIEPKKIDDICQKDDIESNEFKISEFIQRINWKRTGSFVLTGLIAGPLTHGWYSMLDSRFATVNFKNVSKKLLLDQLIAAPLFIFYFFIALGYLENQPLKNSFKELREKFLALYLTDCLVMPIAQAINFVYVIPKYRVLYVYSILLLWDSFLVFIKHSTGKGKEITDYVNQKFSITKSFQDK